MQFTSPLRYPGGKGRLAEFMGQVMCNSDLDGGHYVEAYAGGAGVAITLLLINRAEVVHINDINKSVNAFWRAVLERSDELCRLIREVPVTIDEWHRQRSIQSATDTDFLELGFSTFFLNRTNRSGILLGGVIGGKSQNGKWKLDARFNKEDLISRIQKIAENKDRIKLYKLDAAELLRRVVPNLPQKTFVYLDPPYRKMGSSLYENNYSDEDHKLIAEIAQNELKRPWLVSYDHDPWIAELYNKSSQVAFDLYYSAGPRYRGSEFMAYSSDILLPSSVKPKRSCQESASKITEKAL